MEYLEGRTLAEELAESGPLPVLEAVSFACNLLSALTAVHEKGFVHRDIKPDNLFVCLRPDGTRCLKLLDFGVVRVLPGSEAVEPLPFDFRTRTGVVVGTPRFVSPEGAMGQPVDPRGDLYAAGLTLYIMLVGRGPFDHLHSEQMLLTAHATEDPEPPSTLANEPVPPVLDRLVLKALAKQPLERFQTADEFRQVLEAVADLLRKPAGWLHTTAFDASAVSPKSEPARGASESLGETPATSLLAPPIAAQTSDVAQPESRPEPSARRSQLRVSPGVAVAVVLVAIVLGLLASVGLVSLLQRGP
jgi:serine/threonine protein kinase